MHIYDIHTYIIRHSYITHLFTYLCMCADVFDPPLTWKRGNVSSRTQENCGLLMESMLYPLTRFCAQGKSTEATQKDVYTILMYLDFQFLLH